MRSPTTSSWKPFHAGPWHPGPAWGGNKRQEGQEVDLKTRDLLQANTGRRHSQKCTPTPEDRERRERKRKERRGTKSRRPLWLLPLAAGPPFGKRHKSPTETPGTRGNPSSRETQTLENKHRTTLASAPPRPTSQQGNKGLRCPRSAPGSRCKTLHARTVSPKGADNPQKKTAVG